MANFVEIRNLTKFFPGGIKAVDEISFIIEKGEFLSLLGPSGCGKTTTLRCLAGLERPDEGEIIVDGEVYNLSSKGIMIPPEKRNIGMVFQSYAVWPHMKVFDNIAYGLRMRKTDKKTIRHKVNEVIEIVGLQGLADRPVTKLSGGQQQRVALARALVYNPKLLLFDEPLSNLDAKLRDRMRLELKKLQREIGITSAYVTHDQTEAMTMSDVIIIMNKGKIEQIGNAEIIYKEPRNKFVADFIGIANFLDGEIIKIEDGEEKYAICSVSDGERLHEMKAKVPDDIREKERIVLFFRPEHTLIIKSLERDETNTFNGKISNLVYLGNMIDCRIKVGTKEIRTQISNDEKLSLKEDDKVFIKIDPKDCLCLKV
jgi:iron(III) transport system ATP-binding protein